MSEVDKMNLENYKDSHSKYWKLLHTLVKQIPTDLLIKELKRRKIIKFDWINENYVSESIK